MSELREAVVSTVTVTTDTTPHGSTVAVLTLAADDSKRLAVLGPRGLHNLDAALDSVADDINAGRLSAIIVRGKGRAFCAGADLDMMSSIVDRSDSLALAQQGHAVLRRLGSLGVPVVAEINGAALGGGLELALHCTHRVAGNSVAALGLPEISLGLIPGWGGATLLPRLIGFANSLTVLLDNPVKNNLLLDAERAVALGIVDRVVPDEHLHEDVLRYIDDGLPVSRTEHTISEQDIEALRARAFELSKRPANPAYAIARLVDVLESNATIDGGFRAEDEALADTILTNEFRNRVYSFHLTTQRARKPAGVPSVEPRPITSVGVIGAGLMASQFATLFAERLRIPVTMTDVSQERLDSAIDRIAEGLASRVTRGTLTEAARNAILGNLHTTLDKSDFATCDFVMEAVFEDMTVKVDVLREIEMHVSPECILATNTSSLSVTGMAAALDRPERLIGFHFFNPVAVMPLIEVVATEHTSSETLSSAIACAGALKKTAVITRDLAGFVVNRVLSVFLSEVFDAVDNGVNPDAISAELRPLRLPMDPFALVDLIGRPVTLHMIESLNRFCPERVHVSDSLRAATEHPASSSIAADIVAVRGEGTASAASVHESVCDALTREIDIMISESVVSDIMDIDLCLITGAGWPVAHGGISRYLDDIGSTERVLGRRFHAIP